MIHRKPALAALFVCCTALAGTGATGPIPARAPAVPAAAVTLTVTKAGTGSGTVTSNAGLIDCGQPTCGDTVGSGTAIVLTATPAGGSQFTGWLGPCTGTGNCSFTIADSTTALATFAPTLLGAPALDIDGDGNYDALTDGLLIMRHLFGLPIAAVIDGAVAPDATRGTGALIGDYLADIRPVLDIDGNGRADALTDGLLILRYLLGQRGEGLVAGAVGTGATRFAFGPIETLLNKIGAPGIVIPPDPALVAPPTDPTAPTSVFASTAFLYTGGHPIQTGVAPGTIEARRAAVLRGGVRDGAGLPLPGVAITVLAHPEFGQTRSRADGRFDLAVNGGGVLTVSYARDGYLPVQRQVLAPWQDYTDLPDVVMVVPDSQVTTIDLNSPAPIQAARGNPVTDARGTRRATVLFPAGTQAALVLPDGSTQPLSTLNVRATEYTVGPNGPSAMPGSLPPTSGYTYAVELGADEAIAAGAARVTFSQPLFHYLENFLSFPVGMTVPVGFYDRDRGAWVSSENGRVIKITAVSGGVAVVDTVGTRGLPALVLSVAERTQLALLYTAGQSLWRVPISHFTPYDSNWPYGPPGTAIAPPAEAPQVNERRDDPCTKSGSSIIECENQILGESVGIVGTPFRLHYQSDRVPGRLAAYALDIALSGAVVPASLLRIELEIAVAGRRFTQTFAPAANQRHNFVWDRKDAYGREVRGAAPATVRVGYAYTAVYQQASDVAQSFVAMSGVTLEGVPFRPDIVIWKESRHTLGTLAADVGGWSLSVHHAFDPTAGLLHQGDGARRDARAIGRVIGTAAGNGTFPAGDDGVPATQAGLGEVLNIAVGPDGSQYLVSSGVHRIRRIGPDGIIATIAGTGVAGYGGDGGPANQALLQGVSGVAVAPDGALHIADTGNHRIRRLGPDGIITTVAGTGTAGFGGDGGPADQADLKAPYAVAVGPDGSLYIADTLNQRIRRVGPNGIISTIAGTGDAFYGGDDGPAMLASFRNPGAVAVGPDGSVYVVDRNANRIRRVKPNGIISTVAGGGSNYSGDSIPATQAGLSLDSADPPYGLTVGADGSFYIGDGTTHRIRQVGPDGIIRTVAGLSGFGSAGFHGDSGLAVQASLSSARGVAVAPDGSLYIADTGNRRVRRVADALPGFANIDFSVPSSDGRQLYAFGAGGRHLQTHSAITGGVLYQFTHDAGGRLTAVTDSSGNVTTIERDGAGTPLAITGPYGQTTGLMVNVDGYLSQITSPSGEHIQLSYTTDGLLTGLVNPRGHASGYTFDTAGRLTGATDATGALKTLSRTGTSADSTVTLTTALGHATTYRMERLGNGNARRTTTDPAGKQIQVVKLPNGDQSATYPDGTTITVVLGPDPRWGMQAPLAASVEVTSPGGKLYTKTMERAATLTDATNPLSLATMNDTVRINGRAFATAYNGATRTFTTTSPAGRKTTTVVDPAGRPVQAQFGGLAARSIAYDANGRLTSITQGSGAGSRTTARAYSAAGFVQSVTDAAGRTLAFARDASGRTTGLTFPGGGELHFAWDANGNMTAVTPPGRPDHLFAYTQVNRLATYTAPLVGMQNGQTHYSYDADRQPLQTDRPDGQSAVIHYDSAGRRSLVDVAAGDIAFAYDAAGRLATLGRDQGAALAYSYDGGMATGLAWSGAIAGNLTRDFDDNFRLTALGVNGGGAIALAYDQDGLPVQAGALTLTRHAQNGLVTGTTLGIVGEAMTHDAFGALASRSTSQGGTPVYAATYTRDALGRIATKTETLDGIAHTFAYTYDPAGRLSEVRQDGVLTASYVHDANGNRLSRTDGGGTTVASYDAQDRLVQSGATTYLHNANGERQSKTAGGQSTTYQHDAFGNLTGVTLPAAVQVDYLLDGGHRRVGRKVGGTLVQGFLYQDALKPIAELDGSNNVVSRFVYATGVNVPDYMIKAGATYRIVADHLGSPRLVIDAATGSIAQRLDYDEYGRITQDTNPGFQPFGFAGGLHDPLTGLVHFGAREYDPDAGRWTAKDPIGFRGGDGNLYGYVLGDPVNRTDARGLFFGDLWDWVLGNSGDAPAGDPCPPGPGAGSVEGAVGNAFDELIDDQIDKAVGGGVGNLGQIESGAKFLGPLDTTVNAAQTAAAGFIVVHEATREQNELIDTILSGDTTDQAYSTRRYYSPTGPRPGPRPCGSGGAPCGR